MAAPTHNATEKPGKTGARDVKRILRLQVPVIAVLGQKRMKLGEVLGLNIGSIIQLDKPSEDLLDLMVNDQRVGRGETVRIGENFGLQVVEMGSVEETIRKLGLTDDEPDDETPSDAETDAESAPDGESD